MYCKIALALYNWSWWCTVGDVKCIFIEKKYSKDIEYILNWYCWITKKSGYRLYSMCTVKDINDSVIYYSWEYETNFTSVFVINTW